MGNTHRLWLITKLATCPQMWVCLSAKPILGIGEAKTIALRPFEDRPHQVFSTKKDSTLTQPLTLNFLWLKPLIKPLISMVDRKHWQTIDRSLRCHPLPLQTIDVSRKSHLWLGLVCRIKWQSGSADNLTFLQITIISRQIMSDKG